MEKRGPAVSLRRLLHSLRARSPTESVYNLLLFIPTARRKAGLGSQRSAMASLSGRGSGIALLFEL